MTQPLVFPVGHYIGAFHPSAGAPLSYRKIRVGVDVRRLTTETEFAVWAMTHGTPGLVGPSRPWTRAAVRALAHETELGADTDAILNSLIDNKVVAEVTPGTAEALEFARGHRVLPLLMGVGNTPTEPLSFGIGFPGLPPVVTVDSFLYEVWQWGRLGPTLWDTCELFARVDRTRTPEEVLTRILQNLHILLASNVAYLDAKLDDPEALTEDELQEVQGGAESTG